MICYCGSVKFVLASAIWPGRTGLELLSPSITYPLLQQSKGALIIMEHLVTSSEFDAIFNIYLGGIALGKAGM